MTLKEGEGGIYISEHTISIISLHKPNSIFFTVSVQIISIVCYKSKNTQHEKHQKWEN